MIKNYSEELAQIYQVPPQIFSLPSRLERDLKPETCQHNVLFFFTHPHIQKLLFQAREEGPFSREDITAYQDLQYQGQKSSQIRYAWALRSIANYIIGYSNQETDFSMIASYQKIQQAFFRYNRFKSGNPTLASRKVNRGLEKIFRSFRKELSESQVYPLLFGSYHYGDAEEGSDMDIEYLVANYGANKQRINKLINGIDEAVTEKFGLGNDILEPEGMVVSLEGLEGLETTLYMILSKTTTEIKDYYVKNMSFFPYDWILEGESPFDELGEISRRIIQVKADIRKAIKSDPFFEVLYCLTAFYSLEKRIKNLNRV